MPAGSTVTWTTSPSGIATPLTPNQPQTTLTKNGNGVVTLTATITNACFSVSASKKVSVGTPSFIGTLYFSGTYPTLSTWNSFSGGGAGFVMLDQSLGYSTYYWSLYSGSVASWTQGNQSVYGTRLDFDIGPNQPSGKQFAFNLQATNTCGMLSETYYFYYSGYFGYRLKVFPNPASNMISVEMTSQSVELLPADVDIKEIQIIDRMGGIKMRKQFGRNLRKVTLDINHLPNDIYTLKVFDGTNWTTQKLVVQH